MSLTSEFYRSFTHIYSPLSTPPTYHTFNMMMYATVILILNFDTGMMNIANVTTIKNKTKQLDSIQVSIIESAYQTVLNCSPKYLAKQLATNF